MNGHRGEPSEMQKFGCTLFVALILIAIGTIFAVFPKVFFFCIFVLIVVTLLAVLHAFIWGG
jgi:Tfp pilus assembly protein PilX